MNVYLYWPLLLLVTAVAMLRGSRDARAVTAICVLASVATHFAVAPVALRYSRIETGLLIIDQATLAGFTLIALVSQRFWPLWVAGLQLTSTLAHLFKALHFTLMPQAYAAAERLWVYPIFAIVLIGIVRHQLRLRGRLPS
ncbi:hypothetical protein HMF7854_04630 [Sphingomonas ginkgonis]|uniref:Uncharacterized protein n=1 Tax=Sphingomonas ginkgonis TaxID=2315330 RepID=A0A429V8E3_9SPHN|nr:hypothetical protein [Sphingomonas ginkgonis]RST30194.1 hypothetical protein HMF7854_04630 [Sphingomonas ginkgonis]